MKLNSEQIRRALSQFEAQVVPDDHPMAPHLDVYQWLTVLQEYLVLALMGSR